MSASRHPILDPSLVLEPVEDADEEVFVLYSSLAGKPGRQGAAGLGSVNSRSDHMSIDIGEGLTIELAQDSSALRSRKGDTGSVLWRASVALATLLRSPAAPVLDRSYLAVSSILELGAGTGVLAPALGPLAGSYTATDLDVLVPLMQKNLTLNDCSSRISASALDWTVLQGLSQLKREQHFPVADDLALVLAVDTLYNPSLVPPFLSTLEHYTSRGACALVVCELRAQEVVEVFLQQWLASGRWTVFRLSDTLIELPFVAWVGWQTTTFVKQ